MGPLAIWSGGLGIWAGIALGTLAGLVVPRRQRADIPRFLDAAAPALLVAQAIGRIGNYFNQELFGRPTALPWGLEIDPAHRPNTYAHSTTFHPTFLYELTWNLMLAAALVWLGHQRRIRPPGLFALYIAGYAGFRILEELLRVDPAHHILGLRLNLYVATLLCAAGLAWFTRIQTRPPNRNRLANHHGSAAIAIALLACAAAGCTQPQTSDANIRTKPPAQAAPAAAADALPHRTAHARSGQLAGTGASTRPRPAGSNALAGRGETAAPLTHSREHSPVRLLSEMR